MVGLFLVLGGVTSVWGFDGLPEPGPPSQAVSPTIIGQLKVTLNHQEQGLTLRLAGECGPLPNRPDGTDNVDILVSLTSSSVSPKKFSQADGLEIVSSLDGLEWNFSESTPLLEGCLDTPFTSPIFFVYPHRVVVKTPHLLIMDVVLLNHAPL